MKPASASRRAARLRVSAVAAGVAAAHLSAFFLLGRSGPGEIPVALPPLMVELVRPESPPPPPPPPTVSPSVGGGAPAAPSRIHAPPEPPPAPPEIIAPPEPAPEADPIVVGMAPIATPEPGQGLGGRGSGTGSGVGAGSGPGSGGGAPPRLLVGPTQDQLRAAHPPAALRAGRSGQVELRCRIRLDTRLEGCRVISESPPGMGFGESGLAAAVHFRFRPPTEAGRPVGGREVTVGVTFGRSRR